MNAIIDKIITIFQASPLLVNNTGTHTKIEVYKDFAERLWEIFPVCYFERKKKTLEPFAIGYQMATYQIICVVVVENTNSVSELDEKLDKIEANITTILLTDPKLGNTVYDSKISSVDYGTVFRNNFSMDGIFINLEIKERIATQC